MRKMYSDFNDLLKEYTDIRVKGDVDSSDIIKKITECDRKLIMRDKSVLLQKKMGRLKHFLWSFPAFQKWYCRKKAESLIGRVYPQERLNAYVEDTVNELENNGEKLAEAYALLDDDAKQVFIDLILVRLTGDFSYLLPYYSFEEQYMDEKVSCLRNGQHPNIIDCGGFIGDTLMSFISKGIIPNEYFIFELEEQNFETLEKNIESAEKKGVKVKAIKKGVYNKDGELYFEPAGDSSRIVDYKTDFSIPVVKLDTVASDTKIDYLKMDIEGAEVEALEGAKEIIQRDKPALAICIYHKKDDFWRIPLLIHEICPEYKHYWIRHYSPAYNETVLYVSL